MIQLNEKCVFDLNSTTIQINFEGDFHRKLNGAAITFSFVDFVWAELLSGKRELL